MNLPMVQLYQYTPGHNDDLLMAAWWAKMHGDGDLDDLLLPSAHTLSGFFRLMGAPKVVLFAADGKGIWFAMWVEALMAGAFLGAWVAKERRKSSESLAAFLRAWEMVLTVHPVAFGVTKQERLLRGHERMGYHVLGKAPGLWDGHDAWLVMLTREAFQTTLQRYRRASTLLEGVA